MTQPLALSARFVDIVLSNDVNRVVLERGHLLGVPDWWLEAGDTPSWS